VGDPVADSLNIADPLDYPMVGVSQYIEDQLDSRPMIRNIPFHHQGVFPGRAVV